MFVFVVFFISLCPPWWLCKALHFKCLPLPVFLAVLCVSLFQERFLPLVARSALLSWLVSQRLSLFYTCGSSLLLFSLRSDWLQYAKSRGTIQGRELIGAIQMWGVRIRKDNQQPRFRNLYQLVCHEKGRLSICCAGLRSYQLTIDPRNRHKFRVAQATENHLEPCHIHTNTFQLSNSIAMFENCPLCIFMYLYVSFLAIGTSASSHEPDPQKWSLKYNDHPCRMAERIRTANLHNFQAGPAPSAMMLRRCGKELV